MKRITLLILTALLLFATGCESEESTLELLPYTESAAQTDGIACNVTTLKLHFDPDCYHVRLADPDHLRYAEDTTDTVNTLYSMGYTRCEDCSPLSP